MSEAADRPTLFDRLWEDHIVASLPGGIDQIYIDRHITHEASAVHAFDDLAKRGLSVARPRQTFGVIDHVVPTRGEARQHPTGNIAEMILRFRAGCANQGIWLADTNSPVQGISHVIGHEQGITLPGLSVACSDSHTGTNGALGGLAIPVGITEMVQVLATQTVLMRRPKVLRIEIRGMPSEFVSAKDVILYVISSIGVAGAAGAAIEFFGDYVDQLSIEGRLTMCNMSKEASAVTAIIAADEKVLSYLEGRPFAPAGSDWQAATARWRELYATFRASRADVTIDVSQASPMVTWGTTPADAIAVSDVVPDPAAEENPERRRAMEKALVYMQLRPGQRMTDLAIDSVFIGSCTNGRIEDLRAAAALVRGRLVAPHVTAIVVPGSTQVKLQAEAEGLADIFVAAGFEWRESGCSLCLAMNGDVGRTGERIASTSNRNFEGRQGPMVKTHLVSPAMAAAAALAGRFVDITTL